MGVDTQTTVSQAQSSLRNRTARPTNGNGELEKQDFMNLFLTQMSNQNPVDPMDSGAMMSQLAQLGTMEQLEKLNSQVGELNATQRGISRYQALEFLDKDVMLESGEVQLSRGSGKPIHYMLDQDVNNLRVVIEETDGSPVFAQELGLMTAGKHQFTWDGQNNEGTMMADGNYKIKIMGINADGTSSPLAAYNSGRVTQLEYRNGQPWVKTKNAMMPLAKVKMVDNESRRLFGNASPLPMMRDLPPKGMIVDEKK